MSDTKHTPGPWRFTKSVFGDPLVTDENGTGVQNPKRPRNEINANMTLIAACIWLAATFS